MSRDNDYLESNRDNTFDIENLNYKRNVNFYDLDIKDYPNRETSSFENNNFEDDYIYGNKTNKINIIFKILNIFKRK